MISKWLVITFFAAFISYQEAKCNPSTNFNQEDAVQFDQGINSNNDVQESEQAEVSEVFDIDMAHEQDIDGEEYAEVTQDFKDAEIQSSSARHTRYKQAFSFKCSPGYALYSLDSKYFSNDRSWNFGCRRVSQSAITQCYSTSRNQIKGMLIAQCSPGYAITEIRSSYYASSFDRRWAFKCCKPPKQITDKCRFTRTMNRYLQRTFSYTATTSYVITGIFSIYDQTTNDRYYLGTECKILHC